MNLVRVSRRVVSAVALTVILPLASCASSEAPEVPARAGCEEVRDHVVALQLAQAQATGASLSAETVEAHRAAMVATLGDAYLDGCVERGQAWIDCADRAATATDVGACGEVAP